MSLRFRLACLFVYFSVFSGQAHSHMGIKDGKLVVATSPKGSTNSDMFQDLGRVCQKYSWILQKSTSGSVQSLRTLLAEKHKDSAALAFVQLDALIFHGDFENDEKVKNLSVFLPLNFDEIHVFVHPKSGINRFSELKDKVVGTWGGSYITSEVLKRTSETEFEIKKYKSREQTLKAFENKRIDAVLSVVGQPAQWVKSKKVSTSKYKLIPIDIPEQQVKGIYKKKKKLNYLKFGKKVETYSVQRVLAVRDFNDTKIRSKLRIYQKCAKENLKKLQNSDDAHSKWKDVDIRDLENWRMF